MNSLKFYIANSIYKNSELPEGYVVLIWDNWNDYSYYTSFAIIYKSMNVIYKIGAVKIGYYGQQTGEKRLLKVGDEFTKLDENHFSLGSDDTYYENLNKLGDEMRDLILFSLNDIAKSKKIFKKAIKESVTKYSLLRDISVSTVLTQYRRIALGGSRLTNYFLTYKFAQNNISIQPSKIFFDIKADSTPPSNIHAIIGRNGVGKSFLFYSMLNSIFSNNEIENGVFESNSPQETSSFSNIIYISYSAFDNYNIEVVNKVNKSQPDFYHIGLSRKYDNKVKFDNFSNEFEDSLTHVKSSAKIPRWKNVISILESDPIFKEYNLSSLIENISMSSQIFDSLSSGHKIVLLTITKLTELLNEKSLVFFDEPEIHLHPPLLSSFIRALSWLFTNRNAVCILSTHSPIVIQELPKSSVFILSRFGNHAKYEKPQLETFGENISELSNEIFGLEVTSSGFYNILNELVDTEDTYEDAIRKLEFQLGAEGKAILKSMFLNKKDT